MCIRDSVYDNPVGVLTNNPPFLGQMFALNNYAGVSRKQPESTFAGVLQLDAYSRGMGGMGIPGDPVSYTHLDVYKRQAPRGRPHAFR